MGRMNTALNTVIVNKIDLNEAGLGNHCTREAAFVAFICHADTHVWKKIRVVEK